MKTDKDTMALWNKVFETDPNHTKPVNLGRKFTAIDTYYMIRRATEVFGPCGKGWGWDSPTWTEVGDLIVCDLVLWYGDGMAREGVIYCNGAKQLYTGKGDTKKYDEDAHKKALSDAITKGLSYLGFGGDVFTGMYDDNKYVSTLRDKYNEEEKEKETEEAPPASNTPASKEIAFSTVKNLLKKYDIDGKFITFLSGKKATECSIPELRKIETWIKSIGDPDNNPLPNSLIIRFNEIMAEKGEGYIERAGFDLNWTELDFSSKIKVVKLAYEDSSK